MSVSNRYCQPSLCIPPTASYHLV